MASEGRWRWRRYFLSGKGEILSEEGLNRDPKEPREGATIPDWGNSIQGRKVCTSFGFLRSRRWSVSWQSECSGQYRRGQSGIWASGHVQPCWPQCGKIYRFYLSDKESHWGIFWGGVGEVTWYSLGELLLSCRLQFIWICWTVSSST